MLSLSLLFLLGSPLVSRVYSAECTVAHSLDADVDDSSAILKAFMDCQVDSVITFSQANYSAFTPVSLTGLKNVTVHLNGNLLLPQNVSRVQHEINITQNQPSTYATPWFYIQGEDVTIIGSDDAEWGAFHGFGEQWWNIGNRILRPQLATFNVTNGLLRKLKVIKPIAWGWNLPGKNLRVEDHFVDAAPHNGTRDNTVVCYSFTVGQFLTELLRVLRDRASPLTRMGGAFQTVQNVLFKNWTMDGAVYGARFKSWTGGQGFADNVTWEDITLDGVSTGIFVTQNYYDQDKGARPANTNNTSTKVSNFRFKNFKGVLAANWTDGTCISNPCWNFVEGIDNTKAIIFDLFSGTAVNVSVEGIDIHPANQSSNATVICDPNALAPGEQSTLGFQCETGPFAATEIKSSSGAVRIIENGVAAAIVSAFALLTGLLL
ncbi:putative exopolygalacturonase C [Leucoagaricus sp. SymC.cos]|nr:putative exopolygalacturonase C [Leucoagaricus sp. SymC.cos]